MSGHPLVGVYGHTLTRDGEYQYQFKILGPVNESQQLFAVSFYSWADGRDTNIGFIELADLIADTKCALYESHREWRFKGDNQNHGRETRHRRAQGDVVCFKPGAGQYYNTPEEMRDRVKRDNEEKEDAVRHGRSVNPW